LQALSYRSLRNDLRRGSIAKSSTIQHTGLQTLADESGRNIGLLAAGALIGLLMAAYGILRQTDSTSALPANALARVNDTIISQSDLERAVEPGADAQRLRATLEQLINEEMLTQRALELGIPRSDPEVLAAMLNSIVASVTAEADAADPDDEMLRAHLRSNADQFSYVSKISVRAWQTDAEANAQAFSKAIRTDGADETPGDVTPLADLPGGLLPLSVAADYLGPGIAAAAANMPDGSTAVFARRGRWLIVQLVTKEVESSDDLSAIRNRVLMDYRQTLADELLANYVDSLRQKADVVIASP